ncbi:MAG: hypothetical protein KME27_09615 [Lyngbya sp. HA4199-MV5]|jgi:hypothetical protein|nr:hypothetical protein [Lyngbya sp. HA4199-MV5]
MNKNALTLLGCSGSLAIMLGMANLAEADTTKPSETKVPETADVVEITFSAPQSSFTSQRVAPSSSTNPQNVNVDPASDTVGDLAIAKFRCDCNPCRVAVVQMLQTGQLAL